MRSSTFLFGLTLQVLRAAALPVSERDTPLSFEPQTSDQTPVGQYDWTAGYASDFTIHSSCNATERHELTRGLEEAVTLAQHAKEHIIVHGNNSAIYQKYFGAGPTGAVLGWFDKIATANRAGVIFRCDDPDQNCATQDKWAGHWRGSNASSETVICPRSYLTRLPLAALCARGFTVARGRPADYWAPDLMHRLYHVDLVGEGIVDHYADGYNGCVELAKGENYTLAAVNSATLSYFATEVYAYDISIPGEGCLGKPAAGKTDDGHGAAPALSSTSSAATNVAATATAAATTSINSIRVITTSAAAAAAAATSATSGQDCHTHADGTLHCV